MLFYAGQRIQCRGEEWQILQAQERKILNGATVWEIQARGMSGLIKGQDYCFMSDLEDDLKIVDPADLELVYDVSTRAQHSRIYLEAHLRRLLPRNGAIYLGQHGACEAYDYQLEPAAKALHMLRPRLLIGDAVGLGKTIECGILLSELIRRGKAQRVLAAVPKAILNQFQLEMWGRFSIPFQRLDSKGLERLRQDLPSTMNPFYHFNRALISIDTLKMKKYQKLLQDCEWDVLVIDEAHNVADRTDGGGGSARHRVAKKLAEKSRSVVLMSATPHDGTKYGFASLIKLLDRTAIPSDDGYTKDDVVRHFIRRTRASIRNSGSLNLQKRVSHLKRVPMTAGEIDVLQAIHDTDFQSSGLSRRQVGARELFKTTLIKAFLSSPQAFQETLNNKLKRMQAERPHKKASGEGDTEKLRNLQVELEASGALKKFSRLEALKQFLKENPATNESRIVIFTERLETMRTISNAIVEWGLVDGVYDPKTKVKSSASYVAQVHGQASLSDVELNDTIKAFQSKNVPIHFMVATNIASEGLNLHSNCHRLIHFDLPWSLITLEQRNGRIDRLGQTKQPQIYYFASEAKTATRESNLKDLKDDFWIIGKVESKMGQAGEDMDEEALRNGFSNADEEETALTKAYEEGQIAESAVGEVPDFSDLLNEPVLALEDEKVSKKPLPTLFEQSPGDFVEQVAIAAKLDVKTGQTGPIKLKINHHLKQEIERWPYEFRPDPDAKELVIDPEARRMDEHYRARVSEGIALEKSFMNEIHPALQMLENSAFGLFEGRKTPVIRVEEGLNPESIYFLVQGGLFNNLNEPVFQTWEFIEFERGKNQPTKFINLYEPEHTQEIVNLVRDAFDSAASRANVDEVLLKRAMKLVPQAVEWMKDLVLKARQKRSEELRPLLVEEEKRMKAWEAQRRSYLESVIKGNAQSIAHGGLAVLKRRAEEELEKLDSDRKRYNEFIRSSLATNESPEIRILAVFVGAAT